MTGSKDRTRARTPEPSASSAEPGTAEGATSTMSLFVLTEP
jgi:hypothetical protein